MNMHDKIDYHATADEQAQGWQATMPGMVLVAVLPDIKVVVWNPNEDRAMYFWSTVGTGEGQCSAAA